MSKPGADRAEPKATMTGVIATIPRIQFSNALGLPLAGGKLTTYLAGTTTPEPTYQDQDLTIENPTTITLDSTGSCVLWLDPAKSYKFLLKNALGVTQPGWPVDNIAGAATPLSLTPTLSFYAKLSVLATVVGTSLIGFIQSGAGAVKQMLEDVLRERVTITQFGAKSTNTAAQNGMAIRAAMIEAAARKAVLWVPPGVFLFDFCTPMNNVTIDGEGELKQVQTGAGQTGISKPAGSGSLSNFHIRNIGLDGARVANPGYQYNAIVSIELGANETLEDFSVVGTRMQDAQDHFIRVVPTASTAMTTNIKIRNNRFITTTAKRSLGGSSTPVSMDAFRFEQSWDYGSAGNGYGTVNGRHFDFSGNYCESIRTGGDIKRGASHYRICGNHTKNMYDCHHSADGSFHGVIAGNVCETEATYTGPSTFTNFIEVQGEHVDISGNVCLGGGKVTSGIFVTDYGRPQENGIGHRSVGVTTRNNMVKDVVGNAFRILNGVGCANLDNYCENVGGHVATIESGTGRTDGAIALVATGCKQAGNRSRNAALGVRFAGAGHVKGVNPDENGKDYLYCPGFAVADTFANFISEGSYEELNPNPLLETTGATPNNIRYFDADFYPQVSTAATTPPGVVNAVTLTDDSATQLRATYIRVPAVAGDRIYVRSRFKKNSAEACGFVIEERDAAGGFLSSTFYGTSAPPANWTAYMVAHKVANANAAYLRIGYLPAAANNAPALVGATDVAKLQISRTAIGR
ncbi:MAG: hypothetical protein ACRYF7_22970 [Janthinobacterium lividum]